MLHSFAIFYSKLAPLLKTTKVQCLNINIHHMLKNNLLICALTQIWHN